MIASAHTHTLSAFGWTLLVLFFLQTRRPQPILPPAAPLEQDQQLDQPSDEPSEPSDRPPLIANPTDPAAAVAADSAAAAEAPPAKRARTGAEAGEPANCREETAREAGSGGGGPGGGALLVGFFRFYAFEFNFHTQVVSVGRGLPLDKAGKRGAGGWGAAPAAVEELCHEEVNVGRHVSDTTLGHIRAELAKSYLALAREGAGARQALRTQVGCFRFSRAVKPLTRPLATGEFDSPSKLATPDAA
eukprot:796257-Prorocentrum_minimum.AAC.1